MGKTQQIFPSTNSQTAFTEFAGAKRCHSRLRCLPFSHNNGDLTEGPTKCDSILLSALFLCRNPDGTSSWIANPRNCVQDVATSNSGCSSLLSRRPLDNQSTLTSRNSEKTIWCQAYFPQSTTIPNDKLHQHFGNVRSHTSYSLFAAVVAWANFKQQRWECETNGRLPSDLAPPVFDPGVAVDNSTIHLRAQIGRSIGTKIIFSTGVVPEEMDL